MVLDLIKQFIPWTIVAAIAFFIWLISVNKTRLHKIRHSGRISEIIDRRRNIAFYIAIIIALAIGLFVNLYVI